MNDVSFGGLTLKECLIIYNKIIIYIEEMKIMGTFLSEIELTKIKYKKHVILLPDSDGVDEYTSSFRQM